MLEPKTALVLHVEDDDICLMGMQRAFKAAKIANPICCAHDGIEALEILRGTNGRSRLPHPFVILLDLNMPRMNGIEFLKVIRKDEELKRSIVFILTTSGADKDKDMAYTLGVAGYILKTNPANAFFETTALLETYLRIVELPSYPLPGWNPCHAANAARRRCGTAY
jgi:CheY-like chemotaxis protein